jgi:hypothetical protein
MTDQHDDPSDACTGAGHKAGAVRGDDLASVISERDELLNQKDSLLHTCEAWEKRAEELTAKLAALRDALIASRDVHSGIADHILDARGDKSNLDGLGMFSDLQRSRFAANRVLTYIGPIAAAHDARVRAEALEEAAQALEEVSANWSCGHDARTCDCSGFIEQWDFAAEEVRALIEEGKA